MAFSDTPDAVQAPSADHDDARRIVDAQVADGATATGDALEVAHRRAQARASRRQAPAVGDRAALRRQDDGPAATPSGGPQRRPAEDPDLHGRPRHPRRHGAQPQPFGPPLLVAPDPETLQQIAQVSGGQAFTAEDSDSLKSIYKTLGSQLGTKTQKQQVTASFAVGGLVLLLGAAVASLRWAGRLP